MAWSKLVGHILLLKLRIKCTIKKSCKLLSLEVKWKDELRTRDLTAQTVQIPYGIRKIQIGVKFVRYRIYFIRGLEL